MIKLTPITQERGDGTQGYNVEIPKDYTVQEFILRVVSEYPCRRGTITIFRNGRAIDRPNVEYAYGEIVSEHLMDDYADRKIKLVTADGGRGVMNYSILLKGDYIWGAQKEEKQSEGIESRSGKERS